MALTTTGIRIIRDTKSEFPSLINGIRECADVCKMVTKDQNMQFFMGDSPAGQETLRQFNSIITDTDGKLIPALEQLIRETDNFLDEQTNINSYQVR